MGFVSLYVYYTLVHFFQRAWRFLGWTALCVMLGFALCAAVSAQVEPVGVVGKEMRQMVVRVVWVDADHVMCFGKPAKGCAVRWLAHRECEIRIARGRSGRPVLPRHMTWLIGHEMEHCVWGSFHK